MSDSAPAQAQNWKFPWETDERPQPRRRPRPPAQSGQPGFGTTYNNQGLPGGRSPICLRLEQRLAQEANRGSLARGRLPEIEQGIRVARRSVRRLERELDRRECYETFLFSKTLRRTRSCVRLDRQSRRASTELRDLSAQRQQILGSGDRSYQDDIIRELALNNCGRVYTRENRRRNPFSNFWQDEDSGDRGYRGNTFAGLPFATYRTLCVRLCDGYYFPVSFSTLPPYFNRDAQACQSRCAAPTELYFHQNPGQSVDGMVSQRTQLPYSELKSAFKYRKEYVPGCSCKASEYVAADASNQIAPAPSAGQPQQSPPSGRRGLSPVR